MKINRKDLEIIVNDIERKIKDNFISHIFLINSKDIVFSFSFYRQEKLLISLNHFSPFISFIDKNIVSPTILNETNEFLRKYISGALIKEVKLLNNDRIVSFKLHKKNDFFEIKEYFMIVELIPNRSNLIILDEQKIVLFSTSYNEHIKIKETYESLPLLEKEFVSQIDLNEFRKEVNDYLNDAFLNRKKEKYKTLYTHIKSKISSLEKKIKVLNKELNQANECFKYKELGDELYTLKALSEDEEIEKYIKTIPNYDYRFSLSDNAQIFYKKYKKGLRSQQNIKEQLEKTKETLEEYIFLFNSYEFLTEDELSDLNFEILKQKTKKKTVPHYLPSYVMYENVKIGFGKNTKQNNYLTFKIAKGSDTFFHVKDYHGSHIVVLSEEINDKIKLIAAEIALILSKKECGDILFTKIKNVKKSQKEGRVNLLEYKLITLKEIHQETKDLLLNSKRFEK